jgi:hypothetical protein
MDASQYENYVLVLPFVKYVSDKYAGQKDALSACDRAQASQRGRPASASSSWRSASIGGCVMVFLVMCSLHSVLVICPLTHKDYLARYTCRLH